MTDTEQPFRGESPMGDKGFIMLGQDMNDTVVHFSTSIDGEGFLALDLDLETCTHLHRRLGEMIERLAVAKAKRSLGIQ